MKPTPSEKELLKYCQDHYLFLRVLSKGIMHVSKLQSLISIHWHLRGNITVIQNHGNQFIIFFQSKLDKEYIMHQGSWRLHNLLCIFCPWFPEMPIQSLSINRAYIWISVHGLPMDYYNEKTAKIIGSWFGDYVSYDLTSKMQNTGFRIKVGVHLYRPTFFIPSEIALTKGQPVQLSFLLEQVRIFCNMCGSLLHTSDHCTRVNHYHTQSIHSEIFGPSSSHVNFIQGKYSMRKQAGITLRAHSRYCSAIRSEVILSGLKRIREGESSISKPKKRRLTANSSIYFELYQDDLNWKPFKFETAHPHSQPSTKRRLDVFDFSFLPLTKKLKVEILASQEINTSSHHAYTFHSISQQGSMVELARKFIQSYSQLFGSAEDSGISKRCHIFSLYALFFETRCLQINRRISLFSQMYATSFFFYETMGSFLITRGRKRPWEECLSHSLGSYGACAKKLRACG